MKNTMQLNMAMDTNNYPDSLEKMMSIISAMGSKATKKKAAMR